MEREQIGCLTPSEASLLSVAMAKAPPWLADRTILLTRAGSRAYGTSVPGSDSDFRGVAIAPLRHYLGFANSFERFVFDGQAEGEIEDLRVFMRAACNGEPQVLAVLFCDDCDVVRATESGRALRAARDRFLSKRMAKPFAGHARSIVTRWEKGQPVTSKEAATAVRLVRMLAEILVAGKVCVRRHDADELLAIRRAERPVEIERALREAADGLARVESWARNSTLPEQPDRDWLDGFCAAQVSRAGGERNMVNDAGDRLFTLAEIRATFWKALDGRGDVFFDNSEAARAEGDKPTIDFVWEDMQEVLMNPSSGTEPVQRRLARLANDATRLCNLYAKAFPRNTP
jgi:hypothetical protein